jgi:hypothetical protein
MFVEVANGYVNLDTIRRVTKIKDGSRLTGIGGEHEYESPLSPDEIARQFEPVIPAQPGHYLIFSLEPDGENPE